jgi:hypothetical protein
VLTFEKIATMTQTLNESLVDPLPGHRIELSEVRAARGLIDPSF